MSAPKRRKKVAKKIASRPKVYWDDSPQLNGYGFDFQGFSFNVKDVRLTETRFVCEYDDYHVDARSTDGVSYVGIWAEGRSSDGRTVELKKFESMDKETILIGTWKHAGVEEGFYLFRLRR